MTVAVAPLRVALADDSAESRALLRAMLGGVEGVDLVGVAADGAQAVEVVAEQHPDLILLDIAMPVMDGLEAAAAIRASEPGTKIAMYSAFNRIRMEPDALKAGADVYIEKAVTTGVLLAQIQRLFPDRPALTQRASGSTDAGVPGTRGVAIPAQTSGEQRYRLLLDTLEEGVLITDNAGVISDANFVATQILEAPVSRLVGRRLEEVGLDGGSDGSRTVTEALRTRRPVSRFDYTLTRPDADRRDLMVSVRPLHDPVSLAENAADVVFIAGPDRRIVWIAPSVTAALGWDPEELFGTQLADLLLRRTRWPPSRTGWRSTRRATMSTPRAATSSSCGPSRASTGGCRAIRTP